ncbi:type II toxin-antitoxin system VapC family toxin [Candidatus Micrarchaeota archaeon]|nr:type II toxin-antitoxin system VapC family toxin [Candidatus Micrarchaeota archaeon]MBU2476965.1 type II toxin-antitoxin system VapC family toxin [Candidatus Micrarchaeota archaeon]
MKRVYLDSNVFISFANQEIGSNLRPLFIEAEQFFTLVKKKECILILSYLFFDEVKRKCFSDKEQVLGHFKEIEIKTEVIEPEKEIFIGNFVSKGLHYTDAVHAAIALKEKCDCIITFNIKDFEKVSDKIKVFQPSEFY